MLLIAVEVCPSSVHGLGVFAREAVPAGRIIWQFDPGLDQRHPAAWLAAQPAHVPAFLETYGVIGLDKAEVSIPGDHTLFINHSPTPNLAAQDEPVINGDGVVVAARDIAAGEELTIDYATIDGLCREQAAHGRPLF